MSQRTERVDELLRQEIGVDRRAGHRGSAGRVRHDHRGRDDAGPAPRQGLGQRHRPAGRARRRGRGAPSRHAVHPARAGQAAADQAHPGPPRPARRHRRARHAHPPAPRRARVGREPGAGRAADRVAADAGAARPPARRPRRTSRRRRSASRSAPRPRSRRTGHRPTTPRKGSARRRARARDDASPSTPYLDAVPHAVVDRLRGARRVLAVSHENPDADTLGATLGVVRLVEAMGGAADPVCTDPVPPLYDFMAGVERFRTDPDPAAPYDLLVISDCGSLERIGEVGGAPRGPVRAAAAGHHRPPRLERRRRGGRLDRPGRGRDVRDGHAPRRAARASRSMPPTAASRRR